MRRREREKKESTREREKKDGMNGSVEGRHEGENERGESVREREGKARRRERG